MAISEARLRELAAEMSVLMGGPSVSAQPVLPVLAAPVAIGANVIPFPVRTPIPDAEALALDELIQCIAQRTGKGREQAEVAVRHALDAVLHGHSNA